MKVKNLLVFIFSLFAVFILANSIYAQINPKTIAGAWLFEEGSGKVAKDSSPNGNHGAIEGSPKWVSGKFRKGLEFNGKTDYIVIKDADSLDLNQMTVAAWIKLANYADDIRIISKEESVNDPWSVYSLQISGVSDTKLEFRPTLNKARQRVESIADVPLGQWTHVAATYDGSQVVLYMNGKIDKSAPATGEMMTNDKDVWIGGSEFWTPRFFIGVMDEAVLFNVALSQEEINILVNTGIGIVLAVHKEGKLTTRWAKIKEQEK